MKAYYYRIYDSTYPSITIDEGIVESAESSIFPGQIVGRDEREKYSLPMECEAHHFKSLTAKIEGFYFDIPVEDVFKYKI